MPNLPTTTGSTDQPPNTSPSGVLSDTSIREAVCGGRLMIEPFVSAHVQPCSYDLTVDLIEPLVLEPMRFFLLCTRETIGLPNHIQGQVHGRSSIGRLGILVHFTAGFVDPGFHGQITLEVMSLVESQTIQSGDRLAQIAFAWLDRPAERPYAGRYQHQRGVTPSRFEHGEA
jgi:dCTP deaminase